MPYAYCEQIGKEIQDISDEIPFDIPDSWEWVRLKMICTKLVDGDHNPPKGEIQETKYLMISSTNINNDRIESLDKVRYLSEETFEIENQRTQATKGDIFFTSVGSLGRSCVYNGEYNLAFQRSVSIISTLVFNYYLKYCFDSGYFQYKIQKEATGTAQKGFYLNQLSESLIPIPPFAEQHRIVFKIKELLPYIDKYGEVEKHLTALNTTFPEALKKSILQEAVQGKLVPQNPDDEPASVLLERIRSEKQELIKAGKIKKDKHESVIVTRDKIPYEIIDGKERCIADEVPFELPESWAWVTLGQIVLNVADGPHFSPQYQDEGVPFISTRNIATGKLDFSSAKFISPELHNELCKRCKPQKGDILYSKGGTTGIAAVNDSDTEFNVWVHVAVLSMSSNIYPYYLAMALNSPHCYEQSQKYTHGTSNRDLGLTRMVKITLPLPPLSEQKRIVEKIEELMKYCEKLK